MFYITALDPNSSERIQLADTKYHNIAKDLSAFYSESFDEVEIEEDDTFV